VRIKLGVAFKQKGIAAAAVETALAVLFQELSGIGALGSSQAQDLILKGIQLTAPLFVGLKYLVFHQKLLALGFITLR
jgi:hypothetical protein